MTKPVNRFRGETIGVVEISNTQQLRVEIIESEGGVEEKRISIQKWWRGTKQGEWVPAKGVFAKKEEAVQLLDLIAKAIDEV